MSSSQYNMKRSWEAGPVQPHKKQKHDHSHRKHQSPEAHSVQAQVPGYARFAVPTGLPPLPEIKDSSLAEGPFKHKSTTNYDRTVAKGITYERLEFIGDAYIELIATRLIDDRCDSLPAGRLSQLRELLVKNETLAEFSRAYAFDKRVEVGAMDHMLADSKVKGNKGYNKILGDVFEAYVAAVIKSDFEHGFAIAEKWLTGLWIPKLEEATRNDRFSNIQSNGGPSHSTETNPLEVYNPTAKADLQKRIFASQDVKLNYEQYQDSVELKGAQLGQNRHFVALYLTGYGYDKKLLGKGEGKNKVEAGNRAAQQAMFGEARGIVEECEEKLKVIKEENARRKAERERERSERERSERSAETS